MATLEILNSNNNDFEQNIDIIIKNAKRHTLLNYEPTIDEMTKIYDVIFEFVKKKKLKVYGGFALNLLLLMKNKKVSIYDEDDVPDVDIYSTTPTDDIQELCDILYKKKFENIEAKPALHGDTFKLFVNFQEYCDFTYVPLNIYSNIRYIDIKNINERYNDLKVVNPWFITIDYFRIFCDVAGSYWRLSKQYDRYKLLQKYYPLPKITKSLVLTENNKDIKKVIWMLYDYLSLKENILFTGLYVYNYYLYISKYKNVNKNYQFIDIPYLEIYSANYKEDGIELINYIENLPEEIKSHIRHEERYPFFQFIGYSVIFYYDDKPILYMMSNSNKCLPYKKTNSLKFINGQTVKQDNFINICSFDQNILYSLIRLVIVRVEDKQDLNDLIYKCINGYVVFRNHYVTVNKISVIKDDSLFQSFVIPEKCIGEIILPDREMRLQMKEKKKKGDKNFIFRYIPTENSKHLNSPFFANSSGNAIVNKQKLQLVQNVETEHSSEHISEPISNHVYEHSSEQITNNNNDMHEEDLLSINSVDSDDTMESLTP